MPHLRHRYLSELLVKALKHSPIVGVFGQRQTGKTTMISSIAKEYVSLDRQGNLNLAQNEPMKFFANRLHPFAIDECQMAPEIFPEIKEQVRVLSKPGQFILSGSVRFTSRRAIRESLTGRIFKLELLPMSWAENSSITLNSIPILVGTRKKEKIILDYLNQRNSLKFHGKLKDFMSMGGLPGICYSRDQQIRENKWSIHLETLLERDLRLILNTKLSYPRIYTVLSELAKFQGKILDHSLISKKSRISRATLSLLLRSFEALYLIRRVEIIGGRKGELVFFEDQGLASFLCKDEVSNQMFYRNALFANIFPQFHYRPEIMTQTTHFQTKNNSTIDLVFNGKFGKIGYIAEDDDRASLASKNTATRFTKKHSNSKVFIAHQGKSIHVINEQIFSVPMHLLF